MKRLFLSAYFAYSASLFPAFAGDCSGKTIAFIPTASIPESYKGFVKKDLKALRKLNLTVLEVEVSTQSPDKIAQSLFSADFIYVEGGNTFFLMQELRRTGADKLIVEQVDAGKPYIGMSAGSAIASRNVEYMRLMDDVAAAPNLNDDYSGLGLVDFSVVPHYTNFPFKKRAQNIIDAYGNTLDLKALRNKQAVVVNGESVEIVTAR